MADSQLTQLFLAAVGADQNARQQAMAQLEAFEQQDVGNFMGKLCELLVDASKPPEVRQMAGLQLKNALIAKDEALVQMKSERWINLNPGLRDKIKQMLLTMLQNAEKSIRGTAAQIVGNIASIEIPYKQWPTIIPMLCESITKSQDTNLRHASVEALGYICEKAPDGLHEHAEMILAAIHTGMKGQTNQEIKLAAVTALANSLEFVKGNMANEGQRNLIMTMIMEATQVQDPVNNSEIRVAAYQCIVEICTEYYEYLQAYISVIFQLSSHAIKNEIEDVAKQAIEIWNTICDEEIDIMERQPDGVVCYKFVEQALPNLAPLILETLTKQSEDVDADSDEWNLATAGGVCIDLLAQTAGDSILQPEKHVVPFIEQNLQNSNWHYKEAALIAFGAILNGPNPDLLSPWVEKAWPLLIHLLQDPDVRVKDTAAWTIGRVCEFLPETTKDILNHLMGALYKSLQDVPRIASNACWAISNLAESIDQNSETSPLSPYIEVTIQGLLSLTERSDAHESNLLVSAYEAVSSLLISASKDKYEWISTLLVPLMTQLSKIVEAGDSENGQQVQGLLCGALQVLIQKCTAQFIMDKGDFLMSNFLKVLSTKNSVCHEEAFHAIGALASVMGPNFERYMQALRPHLLQALEEAQAYMTCKATVGIVSELARGLEKRLFQYCDEIMTCLLKNLKEPNVDRSVKPFIISAIGDIAMNIQGEFERYLPFVMDILVGASCLQLEPTDDNLEYLNNLQEAIFEAFTGILFGLGDAGKQDLMLRWAEKMVEFICRVAVDKHREPAIANAAIGLVGDMAKHFGTQRVPSLQHQNVQILLRLDDPEEKALCQENANLAFQMLNP